mmetsp:Transcript_21947/g.65821  ORF Transcript_21947/g.65821 Transcript_21947/m.65821 type:complete len:548 (+) Transcript_21947:366-2009(+)
MMPAQINPSESSDALAELHAEALGEGELVPEAPLAGVKARSVEGDTGVKRFAISVVSLFGAFLCIYILDYVFVKSMLAGEGASKLASYLAVRELFSLALGVTGFTMLGVMSLLGKTSGEGDDAGSGKLMRQALFLSACVGVLGTIVICASYEQLLRVFKPRGDDESLVPGASYQLLIDGCGFVFATMTFAVAGILVATIQYEFFSKSVVCCYGTNFAVSLSLYHHTRLGLAAFGCGLVSAYVSFMVASYFFAKKRRGAWARYGLDRGFFETVSCDDMRRFMRAIGWIGFRSLFSTARQIGTVVAMIRLGVVEGAAYALLLTLQAPAVGLGMMSGGLNTYGARLIGAGETRAFRLYVLFTLKVLMVFCAFWCAGFGLLGANRLVIGRAKRSERAEYRDALEPWVWALAVALLPLRLGDTILDNVLLAMHHFRAMAALYAGAFGLYLFALLYGFWRFRTFGAVFLADVVFYGFRAVAGALYVGGSAWNVLPNEGEAYPAYRAELERLLDGFGTPRLRRAVFLCPRNWQIILAALYRACAQDLKQAVELK